MNAQIDFETARRQMLGQQVRAWEVFDERVLAVLEETPREHFVPAAFRELAFADMEIPLGHGQVMMAPKIEGRLLQALAVEPTDRVLEIGTGSGYLTACLARLGDRVRSVEYYQDFVEAARSKLAQLSIDAEVETADATTLQYGAEFDAIAVTGSVPELDERFVRMLRPGGRLFIIVGRPPVMEARLIRMHENGRYSEDSLFETLITPLINAERPEPFVL
jgi:protein-L-isoaspartate(D-aspartate) O-methyltransferase